MFHVSCKAAFQGQNKVSGYSLYFCSVLSSLAQHQTSSDSLFTLNTTPVLNYGDEGKTMGDVRSRGDSNHELCCVFVCQCLPVVLLRIYVYPVLLLRWGFCTWTKIQTDHRYTHTQSSTLGSAGPTVVLLLFSYL